MMTESTTHRLLSDDATGSSEVIVQGLLETTRKVTAALMPSIEEHMASTDFLPKHGLDFLDTKNCLLVSYLIDLTVHMRDRLAKKEAATNVRRLIEMRTVLDKARALDKKLRYQVDKVLAARSSASSFAAAGGDGATDDPLQFRPHSESFDGEESDSDGDDSSSSSGSDSDSGSCDGSTDFEAFEEEGGEKQDGDEDDDDDDLAAARKTLMLAKGKVNESAAVQPEELSQAAAAYRAPRHAAVPYTHDVNDREAEREKRQLRRLRASELAQTLRSQYGDVPDQEDAHGGTELGRQRQGARRLAEHEAAKTRFEEESMIRLTTTRKEKKERNRLMRQENSNLSAVADLRSLVRDAAFTTTGGKSRQKSVEHHDGAEGQLLSNDRYANRKRKRQTVDSDGKVMDLKGKKSFQARNDLQAELFRGT